MNNSNRKFGKLLLCVLLLIVIGLVAFWFMRHRHESAQPVSMSAENAARKPLYWYDPMAPQQHFDRPGKSPFMDMQLVPKYADEGSNGGSDSGAVSINPRMLQDLGLRTAEVERGTLSASVIATGIVAADERRIEVVQARTAGWVEQLAVRAQGDAVKRGELLAGIYSPDLLAAQQEYLLALNSGREPLAAASRARLQLFGMSSAQIGRVTRLRQTERRVDYYAPIDGYVAELGTRLGMQVTPGMSLFKLVDLSKVWVIAQVPEAQAAQVHVGAAVTAQSASLPGETFSGKVDYVYPDVEPTTRTLRLRFELDNRKLELHPGAYADVTIASGAAHEALLVPSEALIRSGRRTVVIVAQGDGGFTPVEVRTGQSSGERTEILDGLKAGQRVVASGQFLIDSEANLTGALKRLDDKQVNDNPAAATPENAPMNKQGDKTMPGGHTMPMPDGSTMTMPDQQPMQAPAEKSGSAP